MTSSRWRGSIRWASPAFDHVVVMTSSIERTCGEIERVTGEPLKRIREAGPVRQGFHRFGSVIVEVVESTAVSPTTARSGASCWWSTTCTRPPPGWVPTCCRPPKAAVQPGRLIASFRPSVGLGLPIALMTPHVR